MRRLTPKTRSVLTVVAVYVVAFLLAVLVDVSADAEVTTAQHGPIRSYRE